MLRPLVQFRQAILVLSMRMPGARMYTDEPGLQKSRSQTAPIRSRTNVGGTQWHDRGRPILPGMLDSRAIAAMNIQSED